MSVRAYDPFNTYQRGDSVRLSADFTKDEVPSDPDTITLTVKNPSNVIFIYSYAAGTVNRQTTGTYYKDLYLDEVGRWNYRFEGSGTCTAADEKLLNVEPSEF